jgi:hypothetical protein
MIMNYISTYLFPGAQFKGVQSQEGLSDTGAHLANYQCPVVVTIQDCDLDSYRFSGFFEIQNLSADAEYLCTFFEAEICGPRFPLLTRKWDTDEYVDSTHWSKFSGFAPYRDVFNEDAFTVQPYAPESRYMFMRWKELFLVPDHRVQQVSGASFNGFYYIQFDRLTGDIDGYYFYEASDPFQRLRLSFASPRGPRQSFQWT